MGKQNTFNYYVKYSTLILKISNFLKIKRHASDLFSGNGVTVGELGGTVGGELCDANLGYVSYSASEKEVVRMRGRKGGSKSETEKEVWIRQR